jgi:hypothetical protein
MMKERRWSTAGSQKLRSLHHAETELFFHTAEVVTDERDIDHGIIQCTEKAGFDARSIRRKVLRSLQTTCEDMLHRVALAPTSAGNSQAVLDCIAEVLAT